MRSATVPAFVLGALCGVLLGACGSSSSSRTVTLPPSTNEPGIEQDVNRAVIKAAFDRWSTGLDTPYDLLTPNATWTITGESPFSKTYQSKDELMKEFVNPFNARMISPLVPDLQWIDSEGDIVTVRFFAKAIARDHSDYENTYLWQLRVRNEQVVEGVSTFDMKPVEDLWARVPPAY